LQKDEKKAGLETNLTTNLRRRKQELEAVISSADDKSLCDVAESKSRELREAKGSVDDASDQLKSENFS